jgi:hypothetical protein
LANDVLTQVRQRVTGASPIPVPGVRPMMYHVGCLHLVAWQALDYVREPSPAGPSRSTQGTPTITPMPDQQNGKSIAYSGDGRCFNRIIKQVKRVACGFVNMDNFSDQRTAWLRINYVNGDRVVVQAGWSSLEGWSFMPSNFTTVTTPDDLEPVVNARTECLLADLITTIKHNRDVLVPTDQS